MPGPADEHAKDEHANAVSPPHAVRPWHVRVGKSIDRRLSSLSHKLSLAAALFLCAMPLLLVQAGGPRVDPAAVEAPSPSAPPIEIVKARPVPSTNGPPVSPLAPAPQQPAASPPATPAPAVEQPPPSPDVWSETEIEVARKQCADALASLGVVMQDLPPIRQDKCGTPAPVSLKRLGPAAGAVEMSPPAVLNCAMVAKLSVFVEKTLQPAAREAFGSPVIRFNQASGYVCRGRNGDTMANGKISEHALANALDVASFTLADGRTIDVGKHWGPAARNFKTLPPSATAAAQAPKSVAATHDRSGLGAPQPPPQQTARPTPSPAATKTSEALFLRRLHQGACIHFGTVLGPEANDAHREHFHFDLHPRRQSNYCQ